MAEQFPDELIQLDSDEQLLYDLFRRLGCPSPVDPVDPDDCAGMAVEIVRVLREAGRLLPASAVRHEEWAVEITKDDARAVLPSRYRHPKGVAAAWRHFQQADPQVSPKVVSRTVLEVSGPWVPVGTEEQPDE